MLYIITMEGMIHVLSVCCWLYQLLFAVEDVLTVNSLLVENISQRDSAERQWLDGVRLCGGFRELLGSGPSMVIQWHHGQVYQRLDNDAATPLLHNTGSCRDTMMQQ